MAGVSVPLSPHFMTRHGVWSQFQITDAAGLPVRTLSYTRHVSGRTAGQQQTHLSNAAVAFHAAKTVFMFMQDQPTPGELLLGARRILYDEVIILGLRRVSKGTYEILHHPW